MSVVGAIVDDVRLRGDAALIDYTKRFDRVEVEGVEDWSPKSCGAVRPELMNVCGARCARRIENVREFHERQVEES
jgi:histidinol dehydrogenase